MLDIFSEFRKIKNKFLRNFSEKRRHAENDTPEAKHQKTNAIDRSQIKEHHNGLDFPWRSSYWRRKRK